MAHKTSAAGRMTAKKMDAQGQQRERNHARLIHQGMNVPSNQGGSGMEVENLKSPRFPILVISTKVEKGALLTRMKALESGESRCQIRIALTGAAGSTPVRRWSRPWYL